MQLWCGINDGLQNISEQVWVRAVRRECRVNPELHDRGNQENRTGLWTALRLSAGSRYVHWPISILDEINTSSFSGLDPQETDCWISNPHQSSLLSSSCLTVTFLIQTRIACRFDEMHKGKKLNVWTVKKCVGHIWHQKKKIKSVLCVINKWNLFLCLLFLKE